MNRQIRTFIDTTLTEKPAPKQKRCKKTHINQSHIIVVFPTHQARHTFFSQLWPQSCYVSAVNLSFRTMRARGLPENAVLKIAFTFSQYMHCAIPEALWVHCSAERQQKAFLSLHAFS